MEVKLKPNAEKELDKLPDKLAKRIVAAIIQLQTEPFPVNSQKLSGKTGTYRLRVGDYRIIYFWDKIRKLLLVTRIRHRREVYK